MILMSKEKFPTENDESAEEENVLEEGMELSGELSPEAQEIVPKRALMILWKLEKASWKKYTYRVGVKGSPELSIL